VSENTTYMLIVREVVGDLPFAEWTIRQMQTISRRYRLWLGRDGYSPDTYQRMWESA
jgi:hypothetical protein